MVSSGIVVHSPQTVGHRDRHSAARSCPEHWPRSAPSIVIPGDGLWHHVREPHVEQASRHIFLSGFGSCFADETSQRLAATSPVRATWTGPAMRAGVEGGAPPSARKQNIKWQLSMLRAKAGIAPKAPMAVPKRVAQKAKARFKKHGAAPRASDPALRAQLETLESARRVRGQHHQTRQLSKAIKKSKDFLTRKLLRRAKGAASGEAASAVQQRLHALKQLSPNDVANAALASRGIEPCAGDQAAASEDPAAPPTSGGADVRATLQRQLIASAVVQQQLDAWDTAAREPRQQRPRKRELDGGDGDGGSRFISSLAAGSSDGAGDDDDDDDDDGGGGQGAGKGPHAASKRKNYISRSGNRMGQRQRRMLAQQARGGPTQHASRGPAQHAGRGPAPSGPPRGKSRGGDNSASTCHEVARRAKPAKAPAKAPAPPAAAALHPSWEAKRQASSAIRPFQGKRVTFD